MPDVASSSTTSSSSSSVNATLQTITAAALDEKDKQLQLHVESNVGSARTCSLVDFEAFQKMPLNNLSNRSAHWDPKVFRKIAQLIDPPKSPPDAETPEMRPSSPDDKRFESEFFFPFFNA